VVTASAPRSPLSSPEIAPSDRFAALRGLRAVTITYEQIAYAALLVAAVLTRFWDLGSRAMHHDESLHAWFSYQFAIGKGYQHDPLLHGPFLYHFGALNNVLFGVSDATARFGPAIFGVGIVMVPILLRPVIGRWAALICSTMLLVNPAVLYYSRLIRQDVYMMGFALLLIVAIVRYVHAPRPAWVYLAFITLALMHTTHEAAYIVAVIYGAFFFLVVTWRALRPLLAATAGWFAALALAMVVPRLLFRPEALPEIPWDASKGQLSWASWGPYLAAVFTAPQVLAPLVVTILFVGVAVSILMTLHARQVAPGTNANDRLFGGWPNGSIIERLHGLLADRATLVAAATAALVIWTLLYTTLFTNLGGVFSGFAYSLIYWAGQHDVHRGGQPIYYYGFLFPLSAPISCFLGLVASGVTLTRFVRYLQGTRPMTTRFFAQILILWYGTGMFFALTWAGERMPWLICHIIVPFTVLVASYLGEAVEYLTARWRAEHSDAGDVLSGTVRPAAALGVVAHPPLTRNAMVVRADRRTQDIAAVAVAITFVAGWFFAMNRVTDGASGDVRGLFFVGPVGLLAGFWLYARANGAKRAVSLAAITVLLPALLFEMHLAWRLAYFGGDVPTDMLVYTQTAPDIARMQREINALSLQQTGNDHGLVIMDSTSTVWPMNWYLREYIAANRVRSFGSMGTGQVADDVAFVMVGNEDFGAWEDQQLTNFQRTDYVMRWWYPEEYYRAFTYSPDAPRPDYPGLWKVNPVTGKEEAATWGDTILKAGSSIAALGNGPTEMPQATQTPDGQPGEPTMKITPAPTNLLWRYFALREPPQTIGSFNFRLYVRNDLVPAFNGIRY